MSLLDIHAGLSYTAIAPFIGLQPTAKNPVAAECPYCKAHAWAIHKDNRNLEEWHYCSQCKVNGSVLAMAAERLNMPQTEAIQYLADRLHQELPEELLLAYKKSISVTKRYEKFWEIAHNNMRKMPLEFRQVIHDLGWNFPAHIDSDRIMSGPARLFGIAGPRITNQHLKRNFLIKAGAVAVVPFYKTPHQVASFVCFSKGEALGVNRAGEMGFAGLQFLWEMQSSTIVATSMVQQMVKLQMHNFSSSVTPMPLVAWRSGFNDGPNKCWSAFGGRKIVIWESKPTASVLEQALMTDAYLAFVGPEILRQNPFKVSPTHWHQWIHHAPALEIWRRIVKTAKPIEMALKNWARNADLASRTRLLQDAEEHSVSVSALVRSVIAPSIRTSIGRRITVPTTGNGGTYSGSGHTVVIEKGFKWYNLKGQIRWPVTVRVTHIVVRQDKKRELIGYIQNEKTKTAFRVPESEADSGWLRRFGTDNGMIMLAETGTNIFRGKKTENFNPFDAAMRFEEPQIVVGLERVGWDGSGFQFVNCKLSDGAFHLIPDFTLPNKSPGPRQSYCQWREEVKHALKRECVEMEIAWATAIALCAQVTAPAIGLQPYGVCIQRNEHDPITKALFLRFEIDNGPYEDWKHNWPRRLNNIHKAVREDDTGMFLVRVNQAEYKKLGQLTLIDANDPDLEPRNISHSMDKAVLQYLKEFTKQKHEPVYEWETGLNQTSERMQELFAELRSESLNNCTRRLRVH